MKRLLPALLLALASAAFATPPPASSSAQASADAATQQQMEALQNRMNALASRMAALSARLGDQANATALRYLADSRRGMLGIAASHTDDGLRVDAVTPAGPAERAGLETGDVITAVAGKQLSSHESALDALSDLEPGKPARLTVVRNGKTLHVEAVPERFLAKDWRATVRAAERAAGQATARLNSPEFREHIQQQIDSAVREASRASQAAGDAAAQSGAWRISAPWWGLNLAPLNAGLSRYFGTDEGALVLSRDAKRYPQLEPGDVITSIGGKAVADPQAALRAFRDAPEDQPVDVTVRRHDKTLALAFKSPPRWMVMPPLPPPAPPAPPAPPVPPAPTGPAPPPPPAAPPAPPPTTSAKQAR